MQTLIAPLGNFYSDRDIIINDNISIRAINAELYGLLNKLSEDRIIRHPIETKYCLVYSDFDEATNDSRKLMQKIVTCIRLFKKGNIYYTIGIRRSKSWDAKFTKMEMVQPYAIYFFHGWNIEGLPTNFEIDLTVESDFIDFVIPPKKGGLLS